MNLLTQSILAKAFSGELTAEWREQHQDLITGVNSAESLLAKIQAEREASKPVKRRRELNKLFKFYYFKTAFKGTRKSA